MEKVLFFTHTGWFSRMFSSLSPNSKTLALTLEIKMVISTLMVEVHQT